MKSILTLDVETLKWSDEVEGGFDNVAGFGVSCAVFSNSDGTPPERIYTPDDSVKEIVTEIAWSTQDDIQVFLDEADLVVSFNGTRFDFPLLQSIGFDMDAAQQKHFDIWLGFYQATGEMASLDNFAKACGVGAKSADGKKAVQWWKSASTLAKRSQTYAYARATDSDRRIAEAFRAGSARLYESVVEYCINDAKITAEVFDALRRWDGAVSVFCRRPGCEVEAKLEIPEGFRRVPTPESLRKDDLDDIPDDLF